jgi:hypothetical protein
MSEQQKNQYKVSNEDVAEYRMIPIKIAAPVIGNPNVHSLILERISLLTEYRPTLLTLSRLVFINYFRFH